MEITYFESLTATRGTRRRFDEFRELADWLARPHPAPAPDRLDALPGYSTAVFRDDRRRGEGVESVHALGLDLDTGAHSAEVVRALMVGISAIAHTTRRSTHGAPRWRILMQLSRAVGVEEFPGVWRAVARRQAERGVLVDPKTKDPGRFWFVPCRSAIDGSFASMTTSGAPVDVDAILLPKAYEHHDHSEAPDPGARTEELFVAPTPRPGSTRRDTSGVHAVRSPRSAARGPGYALGALRRECEALAAAPVGTRNDRLNRAAWSLGRFVLAGELGEVEVIVSLTAAARVAGLSGPEVAKTIASGLRARGRG